MSNALAMIDSAALVLGRMRQQLWRLRAGRLATLRLLRRNAVSTGGTLFPTACGRVKSSMNPNKLICAAIALLYSAAVSAAEVDARHGTSIQLDNDLFSGQADRDYSFGATLTFDTPSSNRLLAGIDSVREHLSRWLPPSPVQGSLALRSTQLGLIGMTPQHIALRAAQPDDRPYASLVYVATSQVSVSDDARRATYSSFAVGALGLRVAEALQKGVHEGVGGGDAQGWTHQISDGGEPTARFVRAEQWLLTNDESTRATGREVKLTISGSAGYLTEASTALSMRFGRIQSPWWQFAPELADYTAAPIAPAATTDTGIPELYGFVGVRLKARAYNALLQGQFRDSDVRIGSDDLERLQAEAWAGVAYTRAGWRVAYTLRAASQEVSTEPAGRDARVGRHQRRASLLMRLPVPYLSDARSLEGRESSPLENRAVQFGRTFEGLRVL